MGLDIYHLHANGDPRGHALVVHPAPGAEVLKAKLAPLLAIVHNARTDWQATFAERSLDFAQYETGPSTVRYADDSEKEAGCFSFRRRRRRGFWLWPRSDPAAGPACVIFANAPQPEEREIKALSRGAPAEVFYGPLREHLVADTVVYAEHAGYQRRGVADAFYKEFAADEYVSSRAQVEHIHALCDADSRPDFKRDFLDNWQPDASFVIVSY